MSVKFNLLVICAVFLNFGECNNNKRDVYKWDSDWITGALQEFPSTNFTVDTVIDVTKTQEADSSLITDLTRFLTDKFSNLFKLGSLLEVVGNKSKIYVQTFKINDSVFDNGPSIQVTTTTTTTVKPDLISNDRSYINNQNTSNNFKYDIFGIDIMIEEKTTTSKYSGYKDYLKINKSALVENESLVKPAWDKSDVTQKAETEALYSSYTTIRNDDETTTRPLNVNTSVFRIPEIKSKNNVTNMDVTTMTYEVITDNSKVFKNTHIKPDNRDYMNLENIRYMAVNPDGILTLITPEINNEYRIGGTVSQENEISFNDDANNMYHDVHDSDNEIDELVPQNLTDYLDIDYTDLYKDTTNEDVEYKPVIYTTTTTEVVKLLMNEKSADGIESVYRWLATLFIMNVDNRQFEYVCDGVLVSNRVVLTAARCVTKSNKIVEAVNIIVILGKRSLQNIGPSEIVSRINSVKVHDNFIPSEGKVDNDLAVIVLAEQVTFNIDIQPAPLGGEDTSAPLALATTGWHVTGSLQPLYLGLQPTNRCFRETDSKKILCSTLVNDITTCPSYGGVLVYREHDNKWRVKGIATGNPNKGGVCHNKDLAFTMIGNYLDWITKKIKEASK